MNTFIRTNLVNGMRRQAESLVVGGRYRRIAETVVGAGGSPLSRETTLLVYLAPLAQVACAEGRVSDRERAMLLAAARGAGLSEGGPASRELSRWLAGDHGAEFFNETLELLAGAVSGLPREARCTVVYEVVSACVTLADASGGVTGFLGGGKTGLAESEAIRRIATALRQVEEGGPRGGDNSFEGVGGEGGGAMTFARGHDGGADAVTFLMPAVRVAWAEGRVTRRERRVILRAARERGIGDGSAALRELEVSLETKPAEEFFDGEASSLAAALMALPPGLRRVEEQELTLLCGRVAEASGGGLGLFGSDPVSPEEWRELAQLDVRMKGRHGAAIPLA